MSAITAQPRPRLRRDLAAAAQETGVVWAGMLALGIGFGVLVTSHGLPWWLAPLISATMFAGSVEFLLVGMLAATAPIATIALTTFLVNSRHLFYGLSFPLQRIRGRLRKAYSVFALCDEAYALANSKDAATLTGRRLLLMQLGMHASWAVGSLIGGLVGATLLAGVQGLEFVLLGLFAALAVDAWRARPDPVTLGLAVGCVALAGLLAPDALLLVALTTLAVALVVRHRLQKGRVASCVPAAASSATTFDRSAS